MSESASTDGRKAAGDGASAAGGAGSPGVGGRPAGRVRVGVIGCGNVAGAYLRHLGGCRFAQLVSVCDAAGDRARRTAAEFHVPNHYGRIEGMLAGAPFDLLVNLTHMQEHYRLNRLALEGGRHVWSEKPMANSLAEGRELLDLARRKGVRIWSAPAVVNSPQFAFMARALAAGALGRVAAAHAGYGHLGPSWSSFFYEAGGGSIPDLGVYHLTTLTGLLGPAVAVAAMASIVTPTRPIDGKGPIAVEAEDNAMVLIDHGGGALSHVQCGFNYFTAEEHDSTQHSHHTLSIVGTDGIMHLAGYDWAPHGVDLATRDQPELKRHAVDSRGYCWEEGASHVAECLATGKDSPIAPEHAVHVVEIMAAVGRSQRTGRRVAIESTFPWPIATS